MNASLKQRRLGSDLLTPIVINGGRWTARHVQNNNFRQNCKQLARTFRPGGGHQSRVEQLREPCLQLCRVIEQRSKIFELGSAQQYWVQALLRVAAYQEHWIRPPEDWYPDSSAYVPVQFQSLVEHLFCRYPVPAFLTNVWFTKGRLRHSDRDWYCEIGSGASPSRTIRNRAKLSARAAHLFWEVPMRYPINKGIRYAQLTALNASDELIEAVLDCPICDKFGLDEVWIPLFMMMVADSGFNPAFVGAIGDYIVHEYNQKMRFTLRGRTLRELQNSAVQSVEAMMTLATYYGYRYTESAMANSELRRQIFHLSELTWECHPTVKELPDHTIDGDRWQIVELTSQHDLFKEGKILHHCISSWGMSCRQGECHIFSLRLWIEDEAYWDSYVTIAISKCGRIREMRSIFNSLANRGELKVIGLWMKQNGLRR